LQNFAALVVYGVSIVIAAISPLSALALFVAAYAFLALTRFRRTLD